MDLKQAKKLFPVTKELTYLDHAAVCPIPGPASDALIDYAECTAKTGAVDHEQFFVRAQRSKKDFARLIKCRSKNIAFIKNTTAGILIASRSFDYRSGDNVIIGSLEFPGNIYPWVYAKDLEVRVAPQKSGIIPVEQVENLIDNRTRAVSLSLVNYSTGGRNNLEAIGKLCEDKNILFIVDAIQAAGSIEFDVKKIKADFLCADGHKWLLGPEGAGLLYVSDRALESCSPVNSGWFSVQDPFNFENIDQALKEDAGRYEEGTLNVGGFLALSESLKILSGLGIKTVQKEIFRLNRRLCESVTALGGRITSPRDDFSMSGIVCFKMPKLASSVIHRRLKAKKIITALRSGCIRVSPHFYNSDQDIDQLLEVLTTILK